MTTNINLRVTDEFKDILQHVISAMIIEKNGQIITPALAGELSLKCRDVLVHEIETIFNKE